MKLKEQAYDMLLEVLQRTHQLQEKLTDNQIKMQQAIHRQTELIEKSMKHTDQMKLVYEREIKKLHRRIAVLENQIHSNNSNNLH